jgi:hypothetical protein
MDSQEDARVHLPERDSLCGAFWDLLRVSRDIGGNCRMLSTEFGVHRLASFPCGIR